jgi:hypothetical protein
MAAFSARSFGVKPAGEPRCQPGPKNDYNKDLGAADGATPMDAPTAEFALAGSLAELRAKGRLVVHGGHRPILVVYDRGRVFALDNRCPRPGFPLDRGSVDDGVLTCHWHHGDVT